MAFDIIGAKNAGYSDTEIADYISSQNGFDAAGARKAGYSDQEIIGHVSGSVDVGAEAPKPTRIFSTPSKGTQQDVMGIASPKDRQAAETAQTFVKNDIPAVAKTFGAKIGGGMEQSIGGAMRAYGEEDTNRFNVDDSQLAQTRAGRYLNDLTAADNEQRAAIAQRGTELGNEGRAVIQAAQEDQPVQTRAGRILDQAAQSIGSNLPGMAATMVTGSPAVGLSMMGLQSFGQTYDESRAKGLNIADATMNAAIQGGSEVATEMLPFVALSKYLKTGNLSKEVLKHYLSDIPGEHLATAIQNASDAAYNTADMTPQQRIDAAAGYLTSSKHKEDQIDTFFTTVLQGAVMGGVAKVARVGNALAPETQPTAQPAPSGPLSRAVGMADTRAVAPVQSIGSLVAERRGMNQKVEAKPQPYTPNFTMQGGTYDKVAPDEVIPPTANATNLPARTAPVYDTTATEVAPTLTAEQQAIADTFAANPTPVNRAAWEEVQRNLSDPVLAAQMARGREVAAMPRRATAPVQGIGGLVAERRKLAENQGNPDAQISPVAGLSDPVDTSVSPFPAPISPTIGVPNETADEGRQDEYAQGTESNADGKGHGQDEAGLQTVRVGENAAQGETGIAPTPKVEAPAPVERDSPAQEAIAAMREGRVFLSRDGKTFMLSAEGGGGYKPSGKLAKAPWDKSIRAQYPDFRSLYDAAKEAPSVGEESALPAKFSLDLPNTSPVPTEPVLDGRRISTEELRDLVDRPTFSDELDNLVHVPTDTSVLRQPTNAANSKTPPLERHSEGMTGDVQLLRDTLRSKPFLEKGYSGVDVKTQGAVQAAMLRIADNPQVLDTVVKLIPVDVMDVLRRGKLTPEMVFHDPTVLKHTLSANLGEDVPVVVNIADSLVKALTLAGAVVDTRLVTSSTGSSAGQPIHRLTARGTDDRNTRDSLASGGAVARAKKVTASVSGDSGRGFENRPPTGSTVKGSFHNGNVSRYGEGVNTFVKPEELTFQRVQDAFPNQKVAEENGVFIVTTPSGIPVRISTVGEIEFGPEQRAAAEKEYGRPLRDDERPVAEFKPLDHGALINLTEKGVGELSHEVFHLAMNISLTERQKAAVLRTFGNEEKAAAEYQRLKESGALETRKGNYWLAKIYRFLRSLRQLISPTAKGVMEDVASGKVWGKAHAGDGGARYAFARADQIMTPEQKAAVEAAFGTPPTMMDRAKDFKKDLGKNLVQGVLDQYAPIKDIDMGAYMKARMTKGADSTLEAVMLYGKPYIDSTGSIRVEFDSKNEAMNGFATILAELDGEHDRFLKWVAGIRAARLKDIGLENLMSTDTIKALKSLNRDGTAENQLANGQDRAHTYMRVLNHMNAYNDAILKVAVDRGLINDATRQMYKDMPYIPFYRLQDEGVVSGFTVTSGLVNQTAWKKLKGGTNKLNDDMLANMLKNWSHLITASARNEAAAKTLTKALELGAAHEVPAGYPGKGIVSFRENTTTVLKQDQNGEYKRVQGEPLPAGTKYKEGGVDKVSDGTMVPEFNVERHFIVTDPHLLDAITSIGQTVKVPKTLRAFKNALAYSVTINPTFKIRNLIRDSISSIALADLSYNPAKNIAKGYKLTAKDSETRAQMLASGGIMRFGSMLDGANADNARKLIDAGVPTDHILDSPNKVAAVWKKYVVGAFDAYQDFGDRGEQVNRAALYKTFLDKGYTPDEAAFWARDLMDFSMSGKWAAVRFLSQTVPFMNARLQGMYKLGRSAKADKKRFGYVIGGVALASLALLGAYHDDDDWQKREAWDRDNYWWFKIGDKAFRIPKPFEIGAIGSVAEWSAELMLNREMTGKKFAARMRDIVSSQLSMNPTPQIIKPLIDLWANKDSFTQRPIEGMGMDRLKPEDRFNDKTSGVAKLMGQLGMPNPAQIIMGRYEGLSPVQIDFMIRGYFSWLGVMATTTIDYGIFKPLSGATAPSMQLKDTFMIGNFVESLPSNSSRYVSEMYDNAREIEQSYNSYRNAIKSGDRKRAAEIMANDREKIQKHGQVERLKETVADLNRQIKRITASSQYSADQKRAMIDKLKQRQDQIAKRAMQREVAASD